MRLDQESGGIIQDVPVRPRHRVVAGQNHLLGPGVEHFAVLGRLAQVHYYRAGPSRAGDVVGLGHDPGNVLGFGHQIGVFGHRVGDAHDVGLLKGIGANGVHTHLAGHHYQGHRVHHGIGYGGDHVCGPGARGHQADPHLARGDGIALGCVPGGLLVAGQREVEAHLLVDGVVGGQDGPSWNAEDLRDP